MKHNEGGKKIHRSEVIKASSLTAICHTALDYIGRKHRRPREGSGSVPQSGNKTLGKELIDFCFVFFYPKGDVIFKFLEKNEFMKKPSAETWDVDQAGHKSDLHRMLMMHWSLEFKASQLYVCRE